MTARESQNKELVDRMKNVIFLSTPQRESSTMEWSSVVSRVATATTNQGSRLNNTTESPESKKCIDALRITTSKFASYAKNINILSCYEAALDSQSNNVKLLFILRV